MGILTKLCPPLFRQSRYILPNGYEIFENPALSFIKSPYMTGALCGTFYQAATGMPFSGIIPIALAFTIPTALKRFDNDGALQLRPSTVPKIIDKRPDQNAPATAPQLMKYADESKNSARKWISLLTALTVFDAVTRDNPMGAINPISLGLIGDQVMRYMRFRQIVNRHWVMHDKAPQRDEPLHPYKPAIK